MTGPLFRLYCAHYCIVKQSRRQAVKSMDVNTAHFKHEEKKNEEGKAYSRRFDPKV